MDDRAHGLARGQHGVVGRRQLLAAGLTVTEVDALLRTGRVDPVSRGVYRVAGAPETPRAELWAAVLRCGPDARVAGARALALAAVPGVTPDAPFVVLTRPGRRVRGVRWRWRPDPAPLDDATELGGLPGVTPVRALVEAAVDLPDRALEELVDRCRWRGGLLERLGDVAGRLPGHPGVRRLLGSGLVDESAPESPPERGLLAALEGLGGKPQSWVTPRIRADLFFDVGLVVEYDGEASHGGPGARTRDRGRDAALRALGHAIVHVTAADLARPRALRDRVEGILAALGAEPASPPPDGP